MNWRSFEVELQTNLSWAGIIGLNVLLQECVEIYSLLASEATLPNPNTFSEVDKLIINCEFDFLSNWS